VSGTGSAGGAEWISFGGWRGGRSQRYRFSGAATGQPMLASYAREGRHAETTRAWSLGGRSAWVTGFHRLRWRLLPSGSSAAPPGTGRPWGGRPQLTLGSYKKRVGDREGRYRTKAPKINFDQCRLVRRRHLTNSEAHPLGSGFETFDRKALFGGPFFLCPGRSLCSAPIRSHSGPAPRSLVPLGNLLVRPSLSPVQSFG